MAEAAAAATVVAEDILTGKLFILSLCDLTWFHAMSRSLPSALFSLSPWIYLVCCCISRKNALAEWRCITAIFKYDWIEFCPFVGYVTDSMKLQQWIWWK